MKLLIFILFLLIDVSFTYASDSSHQTIPAQKYSFKVSLSENIAFNAENLGSDSAIAVDSEGNPILPSNEDLNPNRTRVLECYNSGAITGWLMQKCMDGIKISGEEFLSCVSSGPCLGEDEVIIVSGSRPPAVEGRYGGGYSYEGKNGEVIAVMEDEKGNQNTFVYSALADWNPTIVFNLPPDSLELTLRNPLVKANLKLAIPAIPDIQITRICYNQQKQLRASNNEFMQCLNERAMPKEYRLTKRCMNIYKNEPANAVVCSLNNVELTKNYKTFKEAYQCVANNNQENIVENCIGNNFLGHREQEWKNCITQNKGDISASFACGMSQDLTPEQQIAIGCAIKTGGEPYSFAACTGGQLVTRELDKCWNNGIGTSNGCFGPNNEIYVYWNKADSIVKKGFGANSEIYKSFNFLKQNLFAPGPNHDFVKVANMAMRDLQNGPGPNNDAVKAINIVAQGVSSVGQVIDDVACTIANVFGGC